MTKSIFTKIIDREIPSEIVYENDNLIVIKDINPEAKTHLLIIPKKPIESINDISFEDKDILFEMFEIAKNIAKDMWIEKWYTLKFNVWELAQDIMHLHLHLKSNI